LPAFVQLPPCFAGNFSRFEKSQSEERFRVSGVIGVRQLARQILERL
jgi:hypothetical protein